MTILLKSGSKAKIKAIVSITYLAVGALWVTQGNLLSAFQAVLAATTIPHH